MVQFSKAVKHEAKLRMALIGPAGSGKTYTALQIAQALGGPVALLDTEHGSAAKYSDLFEFDTFAPDSFSPTVYIDAIKAAEANGYNVLILDSLSHAWAGKEGALEQVDNAAKRSPSHNTFAAWRDVTPLHNRMIDAILGANLHVIATMRTKTEYVQEKDGNNRTVIRKVGLQPVQRDGMEYEFDVVADLDWENTLIVGKTRCPILSGKMFTKDGGAVADILKAWLAGAPAPAQPETPKQEAPKAEAVQNGNGRHKSEPTGKPASIKGSKQWKQLADELAARCPYYRNANGTTNYPHMLGAAGKCGWEVITDDNAGQVITAIEAYANKNANAEAAEPQQELPLA